MAQNTSLLKAFGNKFFDNKKASNILCSVDFGKSLFKYINHKNPNPIPVPNDSAKILKSVQKMMQTGKFGSVNVDDDFFVRFFISKVNEDPGLVTFEMIADVLNSSAYKSFGNNPKDKKSKIKFERWIYNKSILSKINDISLVDVVLHKEAMVDVINNINSKNKKTNNDTIYQKQLDEKEKAFEEIFNKNKDALTKLKDAAKKHKNKHPDWIKGVYDALCDSDDAEYINEIVDFVDADSKVKERNFNMLGLGTATNKVILAVAQKRGWSDQDIDAVLVKTNSEYNAERFNEINEIKNGVKKQGWYEKNAVLDVCTTFLSTAGFSTIISTLSQTIPFVAPLFAGASVAVSGITTYAKAYHDAKKTGTLTKQQERAMAFKAASEMGKKLAPYAITITLGMIPGVGGILSRSFGIAHVFAKTLIDDLRRRSDIDEQLEVDESLSLSDKIKGKLRHLRNLKKSLSITDFGKSSLYALSKGLAVAAGSFGGEHLGTRLGNVLNGGAFERPLSLKNELNELEQDALRKEQIQTDAELNTDGEGQMQVNNEMAQQAGNNVNTLSEVEQYMQDHPDAYLDKNGWMVNADGSYARNENGQLFGVEKRVFRALNSNEMLDKYGNIVDRVSTGGQSVSTETSDFVSTVTEVEDYVSEFVAMPKNTPEATFSSQVTKTEMPVDYESLYHKPSVSELISPVSELTESQPVQDSHSTTQSTTNTMTNPSDVKVNTSLATETKTRISLPSNSTQAEIKRPVETNTVDNLSKLKTILMPGTTADAVFTENGNNNLDYEFINALKMPENEY